MHEFVTQLSEIEHSFILRRKILKNTFFFLKKKIVNRYEFQFFI